MLYVAHIRITPHRVLAKDDHTLDRPVLQAVQHLHDGVAHLIGELGFPRIFELFLVILVSDHLVRGIDVRKAAHVASPLNVVLTAQGVNACAVFSHVSGQHREIGEALHIVHSVGVLSDAHSVQDGTALGRSVHLRDLDDVVNRNSADFGCFLRRIVLEDLL